MQNFYRFPHTPHLACLVDQLPRDDKMLSSAEALDLLETEVWVEEKIDGANLGISLGSDCVLLCQNRGHYLTEPYKGQFSRLNNWLACHEAGLRSVLTPQLIVFGEWCAARHSLDYDSLPDWFLLFDVYDRQENRFWSVRRRNELALQAGLSCVPFITSGKITMKVLEQLVQTGKSSYRAGGMEGIVIRRDSKDWCEQRAKLVRADFVQNIEGHWSRRLLEWNRLDG